MTTATIDNENFYGDENENVHENKNSDNKNESVLVKNILLFKNGDQYFPGKRVVVNKKYTPNWDCFLEDLTKSLNPRNGAIRDIRTPYHGTRIKSLEDLSTNGKYVALSKGESLKIINYDKVINVNSLPNHTKSNSFRLKPLRLANRDMDKIESRITQNLYTKSNIIYVFKNGDRFTPAIKVVIKSQEQKHMNVLVKAIEDRVLLQTNKPIRRLYTLNGDVIRYAKDIENGKFYVAASNEPFENIEYGQVLPVIRGGRVHSKRNKIKFLNQMPSPKSDKRSQGSSNDEPTDRSTQSVEPIKVKPRNSEKRQLKKEKNDKEIAAIKIQATFRGFQTRKAIEKAKENNEPIPKRQNVYIPKKIKSKNSEKETPEQEKPIKVNYSKVKKDEKEMPTKPQKLQNKPKNVESKNTNQNNTNPNKTTVDEKRYKAAVKIQAGFRGYQTRKHLTYNKTETKVSQKQKPSQSKKLTAQIESDYDIKEKAAMKIQAGFRGYHTRQILKRKVVPKPKKAPEKNDGKMQEPKSVNKTSDNNKEAMEKAAVTIQAGFRGYHTRQTLRNKVPDKTTKEPEKEIKSNQEPLNENKDTAIEKAAITIQAGFRGYRIRKNLKLKEKAAQTIQAGFRGYKTRRILKQNNQQKQKDDINNSNNNKNEAAKRIQAGFRGFKTRKEIKIRERENQENAAIKIQAGFRGYKTRKEFMMREKSAERIQAGFRSYKTRKEVSEKSIKKPKYLSPEEQAQERNDAAAKIQAAFRGHVYRKDHS